MAAAPGQHVPQEVAGSCGGSCAPRALGKVEELVRMAQGRRVGHAVAFRHICTLGAQGAVEQSCAQGGAQCL